MTIKDSLKSWWSYKMMQFDLGKQMGFEMMQEREEKKKAAKEARDGKH